jgi:hypothetical protein
MSNKISWSTLSPRERDAVVAERLHLLSHEIQQPYEMIDDEPIWVAAGTRHPFTCKHYTTAWSAMKDVLAAVRQRLDDAGGDGFIVMESSVDDAWWARLLPSHRDAMHIDSVNVSLPVAVCEVALMYWGFELL